MALASSAGRNALAPSTETAPTAPRVTVHGLELGHILASAHDAARAAGDIVETRAAIVGVLSTALNAARARIAEAFAARPRSSSDITAAYAEITDLTVQMVHDLAGAHLLSPAHDATKPSMAILAVGGYGRAEMALHSDVDLLFLTPPGGEAEAERLVEAMLYVLWDLKLKVGHATRSIRDCLRLAREDYTIRTSLVEMRDLGGNPALFQELRQRLWGELFKSTARDYIEAKLDERSKRHRKQGGQRYVVEPNVKEGKGGLRDLQSLFWIAKYIHGVRDAADLVPLGLLTGEEFERFRKADDFLWAIRCHLHIATGRA
ncbi:MAG: [protein-PII] uridylyltransferase, partial [Pseudomonadota bacterium]